MGEDRSLARPSCDPIGSQVIENALVNAGLKKEDVDWLVMHQANQRIMDAAAERLELPSGVE